MKKKDIVKSKIIFNNIIKDGKRISNRYYVICSVKNEEDKNIFGLAVGKKIGNAVTRNKIKRQIRTIIDNNWDLFPKYNKYIIICKKDILNLSYQDMDKNLINLINKEI